MTHTPSAWLMEPTALATLLPHGWFAGITQNWVLLLIAIAAMVFVIKGADWLVEGAAGIARKLGMPEVVVGATIVSLGTTSPEMAVSVLAAFSGNAGLALGNGVGSIIADSGLIFGIGLLMTRLPADKFVLSRQGWVQFGSGVMLAGLCYMMFAVHGTQLDADGVPLARLERWVGVLLVALLVGYLVISIKWAKQHPVGEPHLVVEAETTGEEPAVRTDRKTQLGHSLGALFGLLLVGLAIVVFAGDALVQSVTVVAERWGVPDEVIASTLVALGTSLPELVVGVTAIRKRHPELLVGNVIGADILNVLFVIGFAAVAKPLPVINPDASPSTLFLLLPVPVMLIMLLLIRLYIFKAAKTGRFDRWMGVPLVALYVAFILASYLMARPQ